MSRSALAVASRARGPIVVTWTVGVVLSFFVHRGEGLGWPYLGPALSAAALPSFFVSLAPGRARRLAATAAIVLLGIVAAADAVYHRAFDTYLPFRAMALVSQAWDVRGYAFELLRVSDLFGPAIALAGLWVVLTAPPPEIAARSIGHSALPAVACLLGFLPALGWAAYVAPSDADHATGGFLYAHVVDASRTAMEWRRGNDRTPEEQARVIAYVETHPKPDTVSDPWFGRARGTSVLMVQVEALNEWLLDAEVDGEPVVPVLRSLAARGLRFTNVFEQIHQGRSSDADYLVMASQHPLERGAVSMLRPTLDPLGLADILHGEGYATLSAHAHHKGFWNAGMRHPRYGFQESLFDVDLGPGDSLGFGLTDAEFFRRTAPHIEALSRPYLAWLITLSMHAPYTWPPPSFQVLPLGRLDGTPLGGYFLRARHTDAALGHLLARLEENGALDNTMLVIFGDHTEELGFAEAQLDSIAHVRSSAPGARELLRARVPLLVVLPGKEQGRRIDTVGGTIDVGPTVLYLLGVESPRQFMGRPILRQHPGFAALASGEVVAADRMWTGRGCFSFPQGKLLGDSDCLGIRAQAREQLEVSWIVTRTGVDDRSLGPSLPPPT